MHCEGTLGLECRKFKEEHWKTQAQRDDWILQESEENVRRNISNKKTNDPRRLVEEPEIYKHEERTPGHADNK